MLRALQSLERLRLRLSAWSVAVCSKEIQYNDGFSLKWVQYLSPPEWRGRVDVEFTDVPLGRIEHADAGLASPTARQGRL